MVSTSGTETPPVEKKVKTENAALKWFLAGPYTDKLFGRDVDLEPYDLTKIMKTNSIEFNTERQITVIHGANDGNSAT